jgi:hypothetical protein
MSSYCHRCAAALGYLQDMYTSDPLQSPYQLEKFIKHTVPLTHPFASVFKQHEHWSVRQLRGGHRRFGRRRIGRAWATQFYLARWAPNGLPLQGWRSNWTYRRCEAGPVLGGNKGARVSGEGCRPGHTDVYPLWRTCLYMSAAEIRSNNRIELTALRAAAHTAR